MIMDVYIPVYKNPIEETGYEGMAKVLKRRQIRFSFGDKEYHECSLIFFGSKTPVTRVIDNEYVEFLF